MDDLKYKPQKNILVNFFINRFPSQSIGEHGSYFKQWVKRFQKPISKLMGYMDNYSRTVFIKVLLKKAHRTGLQDTHLHEIREYIDVLLKESES